MVDAKEIAKWREAHPGIYVPEIGLMTVAPFPSLYAGDFAVYLEAKAANPEVVRFVQDMSREIAWVYGSWQQAQRDAAAHLLVADMLNSATTVAGPGVDTVDYSQVRRFLTDYATAHGIQLATDAAAKPAWMTALDAPGVVEGMGVSQINGDGDMPLPAVSAAYDINPITAPPPLPPKKVDTYVDR